ncbi:hypothetical protein CJF30_00006036 [Rutstroemia sp. NJR-2017a BBW]|nr:hypothetical protein CJF30_00006036 [Rutstroemia sp. NJR-2017a BBW]
MVLAGKDAQQNETLYKKYLRKGDVYLHADMHGAATVIIRNNAKTPDAPIPPQTLSQAGTLAVATSNAWDAKAGMSAWWVNADQVSKSAPTGEFLPTGSFMVRGKKNFLPPAQLLLGFGVLFQISDESKARHVKHRLHDEDTLHSAKTDAVPVDDAMSEQGSAHEPNQSDNDEPNPSTEVDRTEDHESEDSDNDEEDVETHANPLQSQQKDDESKDEPLQQQLEDLDVNDKPPQSSLADAQVDVSEDESVDTSQPTTGAQTPSTQATSKKGPAPAKRGQRGKAKKIANKYKDQDEEDRIAAQILIGAAAGREKAEAEAKAKAAREAEAAFQRERRRAQHERTQKEIAENEEIRKLMLKEGIETLDDSEAEKMTSLDSFVGLPLPGDEILEAIPPGAQKKGKAVKEILGKWVVDAGSKGKVDEESRDTERMWPREVELIKGWKPEEVTNIVPVSKVRIMMAGGSAGASGGKGDKGKSGGGRGGKGSKKR